MTEHKYFQTDEWYKTKIKEVEEKIVRLKKEIENENTLLGSPQKYKMLNFLTKKVMSLTRNEKVYIISLLNKFNEKLKKFDVIEDKKFKTYLLNLMRNDYIQKFDGMQNKYDVDTISYLKNYVKARINNNNNSL